MSEKLIDEKLLKEYYGIFNDTEKMKTFYSYYKALTQLVKKYPMEFTNEVRDEWGLNELLSIDEEEYIVDNPDICLSKEKKRLVREYENIDTLAMAIRDTLWDMVTVYSGKDCPVNANEELRYIRIVYADNSDKMLLECPECGWTEDVSGNEYMGPVGKVFPINKNEIEKYIK